MQKKQDLHPKRKMKLDVNDRKAGFTSKKKNRIGRKCQKNRIYIQM